MSDDENTRRSAFISNVISIVNDCHSHNITGTCKRLEATFHRFQSQCVFNALYSVKFVMMLDHIRSRLAQLRFYSATDDKELAAIRRECLSIVGTLNVLVDCMELLPLKIETESIEEAEPAEQPALLKAAS